MRLRTDPRWIFLSVTLGAVLAMPRTALACSAPKADFDHNGTTDIKLVGDTKKQNAIVELRSGGYLVQIDCDGNGTYTGAVDVNASGTDEIETYIIALAGGDVVTVRQTADLVGASKNVVAVFSGGTNKLTFLSQGFGSSGHSNLGFEVGGGGGADTFTIDFSGSSISQTLIVARGILGNGANVGSVIGPASVADSVIDVAVDLGLGNTNGAYSDGGGILSRSALNVHFTGGDVSTAGDTVTTTFSGKLQDLSRVYIASDLRQGNDKYFGHFDISSFAIDDVGIGDSEMVVRVDMGSGFDISKVDDLGAAGPATINGALVHDITLGQQPDAANILWNGLTGSGIFAYRIDGGWANDKLNATIVADSSATNTILFANHGNTEQDISPLVADLVNVTFDAGSSVSYGALGGLLLDGGMQGDDVCTFVGSALPSAINCEKGVW
jgi:hypothetical protein